MIRAQTTATFSMRPSHNVGSNKLVSYRNISSGFVSGFVSAFVSAIVDC